MMEVVRRGTTVPLPLTKNRFPAVCMVVACGPTGLSTDEPALEVWKVEGALQTPISRSAVVLLVSFLDLILTVGTFSVSSVKRMDDGALPCH